MVDSLGNGEAVAESNTCVYGCSQNTQPAAPMSYQATVKAKSPSPHHLQPI